MLEIRLDGEDDGIGSAITDDVIALDWRIGMQGRYDALSVPGYAWIVLNNRTGSYSPERGAALSGKWVTIRDEERIYFSGIIMQVEPLAGEYGDKSVRLIAQGREAELQQQILDLPVMTQVESGAALHAILDRVRLRRRGLAGYCILDAANHNLIDSVSIFTPYDDDRSLQTGKTRFGLLAEAPLSALEQIRRIVSAEGGRFYFNRAAAARFVDRHRSEERR